MPALPESRRTTRTTLAALEVLVALDTHGSISAAARALDVSQPSASTALRRLERELGLEMLTRTSRGTHLTEPGRTVASWARTVLDASDTFEQSITTLQQTPAQRVRLAASMTIAEHLVPRWLARLTNVELLVRNSSAVMDLVLAGAADLGFVEGSSVRRGIRSKTILRDSLVVVVGSQHPWARRRTARASVAELIASRLVIREAGSGTRDVLEQGLAALGAHLPDQLPHLGSTSALRTTVQFSDSVTVLSELAVADDLARGTLVGIEVPGLVLSRKLRMVWKDGVGMPAPVREIAALVMASTPGPAHR